MCHMTCVTCHNFFVGQSGEANRWRVCFQRGLPRPVYSLHSYSSTVLQWVALQYHWVELHWTRWIINLLLWFWQFKYKTVSILDTKESITWPFLRENLVPLWLKWLNIGMYHKLCSKSGGIKQASIIKHVTDLGPSICWWSMYNI